MTTVKNMKINDKFGENKILSIDGGNMIGIASVENNAKGL